MDKMFRRFTIVLGALVLALGLFAVAQVSAQVISGDLVGTILDKTGAVVPNAAVEAVNADTGVKYTTKANDTGEYRFNNLPVASIPCQRHRRILPPRRSAASELS